MFKNIVATSAVSALTLTGCATAPMVAAKPNHIKNVARHIECELYKAADEQKRKKRPWINGWAATVVLTLKVERSFSAGPKTSLVAPLTTNVFNLSADGGVDQDLTRSTNLTYTFSFDSLDEDACNEALPANEPLVTGDLGLNTLIDEGLSALIDGPPPIGDLPNISQTIEFKATYSLNAVPEIAITRTSGRKNNLSGVFGFENVNTSTLVLSVAGNIPLEDLPRVASRPKKPAGAEATKKPSGDGPEKKAQARPSGTPYLAPGYIRPYSAPVIRLDPGRASRDGATQEILRNLELER